ncbi:MAG TPA: hypothetical protein VIL86_03000 [Tepidisphaeraceae bacterium]
MSSSDLPRVDNNQLPTIWIDVAMLMVRGDGIASLRLFTMLPDMLVEGCRIQLTTEHLKRMLDKFSKTLNHYPKPDEDIPSETADSNEL